MANKQINELPDLNEAIELIALVPIQLADGTTGHVSVQTLLQTLTPTLQAILDGDRSLADGLNFQGTGSGDGNTGTNVNAFGESAAESNEGSEVNALGMRSGAGNTGQNMNALGKDAGRANSGVSLNALGINAGKDNTGNHVNALGESAGLANNQSHVSLFGLNASANRSNQVVFSKDGTVMFRLTLTGLTTSRELTVGNRSGILSTISVLDNFTNDTAAASGGIPVGNLYHTNGVVKVRLI